MRTLIWVGVALTVALVHASDDFDDFEETQTEFYLPFSITEDVDFNIVRPGGSGCYQWYLLLSLLRIWPL